MERKESPQEVIKTAEQIMTTPFSIVYSKLQKE